MYVFIVVVQIKCYINPDIGVFADIATWSAVEIETGLICASAPATKPLIRKWVPSFLSSTALGTSEPERYSHQTHDGARPTTRDVAEYGFELDSQPKQEFSAMGDNESRLFWRGDEESVGTQMEDSESVRSILGERSLNGGIVKTVSVTITMNATRLE